MNKHFSCAPVEELVLGLYFSWHFTHPTSSPIGLQMVCTLAYVSRYCTKYY